MQPHKRHTELTHHILSEDEYEYNWWYEYHNEWIDWKETDPGIEYDCIKLYKEETLFSRNRWYNFPHRIIQNSPIIMVDMNSIYSKERKRDIMIGKIFGEELDSKNTIENLTHK